MDSIDLLAIKTKLDGAPEVDDITRVSRYSICKSCPELIAYNNVCNICNCWMPLKARLPLTRCPLNKWDR